MLSPRNAGLTFALLACAISIFAEFTDEDLDFAVKIWTKAYDAACWYEGGVKFPLVHDKKLPIACMYTLRSVKSFPDWTKPMNIPMWNRLDMLGQSLGSGNFRQFPSEYQDACVQFTKDPAGKPGVDESAALEDGGKDYPFRAHAYCIFNLMRKNGGDKIVETWKAERNMDFRLAMLQRHNQLRERHSSPALIIDESLNEGAQSWADILASECTIRHAGFKVTSKEPLGQKSPIGENLSLPTLLNDTLLLGLMATNGWYMEIKDYTYPDTFISFEESKPPGSELSGEKQTGHFTQVLWKETERAGFAITCNPKCARGGYCAIVARYWPSGNFFIGNGKDTLFKDNVLRPKDE